MYIETVEAVVHFTVGQSCLKVSVVVELNSWAINNLSAKEQQRVSCTDLMLMLPACKFCQDPDLLLNPLNYLFCDISTCNEILDAGQEYCRSTGRKNIYI